MTSANINNSKYLCIVEAGNVADDVDSVVDVLAALWILNPKINDDVPIRKDITVRIFWVRPGTIATGSPWLVSACGCGCGCDAASATSIDTKENKI
jgi:hypothetical protein